MRRKGSTSRVDMVKIASSSTNLTAVIREGDVPDNMTPYCLLAEDVSIAGRQDTCWQYAHGPRQKAVARVTKERAKDQKEKIEEDPNLQSAKGRSVWRKNDLRQNFRRVAHLFWKRSYGKRRWSQTLLPKKTKQRTANQRSSWGDYAKFKGTTKQRRQRTLERQNSKVRECLTTKIAEVSHSQKTKGQEEDERCKVRTVVWWKLFSVQHKVFIGTGCLTQNCSCRRL